MSWSFTHLYFLHSLSHYIANYTQLIIKHKSGVKLLCLWIWKMAGREFGNGIGRRDG